MPWGPARTTPPCRFRWRLTNAPQRRTRIRKGNLLPCWRAHFRARSIPTNELRTPGFPAIAHGEQLFPTNFRRWTAASIAQPCRWQNGNSCPPSPTKNPCFSKRPARSRRLLQNWLILAFGPPFVLPRALPTSPGRPTDCPKPKHPGPMRRRARSKMPDPGSTNRWP